MEPAAGWLSVPSVAAVIKYSCLCWSFREKSSVEQEIKEKEENIRQRTSEVQVRMCPCFIVIIREMTCKWFCGVQFLPFGKTHLLNIPCF